MEDRRKLDLILRIEIAAFAIASAIHAGAFIHGYEHTGARIAEAVIAVVLLIGLLVAGLKPSLATGAVLAAQGFALLGTLAGVTVVIIGVGPRTVPDIVYHIVMLAVAAWGFVLARRWRRRSGQEGSPPV